MATQHSTHPGPVAGTIPVQADSPVRDVPMQLAG